MSMLYRTSNEYLVLLAWGQLSLVGWWIGLVDYCSVNPNMRWSCSSAICPTCVFPLIYTNNGTVPPALRPKYKQQICLKLAIMKPQNTKYQLSWQQHCSFLENKYSLPSNGGDTLAARYHPVSPYTAARAVTMVREWIRWWTLLYLNIWATYFMFCFRSNDISLKWGKWKLYRLFKWNKQPKKKLK